MEKLDVKVGDKVIAQYRDRKWVTKVTKITPTGRIRIDGSSAQFSPEGYELGGDSWWRTSLHPYVEEIEKQIVENNTKRSAVLNMSNVGIELADRISLEDAKTINRILLKYQREKQGE